MFNPYDHMKAKQKKSYNDSMHWNYLFNVLLSMFEYKNLPDTLRPEFIETMFITQGHCGVTKYKGELFTGPGGFTGDIFNFMPTEYLITVAGLNNPGELRGKIGEKFAVGWNNANISPDLALLQFSSVLSEIDVSERVNLLFTRFLRIPKVRDSKEKTVIEEAIKAIMDGRFTAVVSDNIEKILGDEPDENRFLDLVDVKEVDKLQYLNQYRDNIVKRFYQMYGQGMQSTAKLAQQTTDELHGNDAVSMIIPLQRLYYRKMFVEAVNKLFGTSISVDFSEAWKESREEMHEDDINEVQDEHTAEDGNTEGGAENEKES